MYRRFLPLNLFVILQTKMFESYKKCRKKITMSFNNHALLRGFFTLCIVCDYTFSYLSNRVTKDLTLEMIEN